jgi:hypothetical protein
MLTGQKYRNESFTKPPLLIFITEASQRPYIRFVPVKTKCQQEILCLHRIRERLIKNKGALSNQARGLLSEFGVVFPCGHKALLNGLNGVIDNAQYSHR